MTGSPEPFGKDGDCMRAATELPEEKAKGNESGGETVSSTTGSGGAGNHIRWLVRYGIAAVLFLVGLMQLVNGLALVFYGTVASAPWQFLVGGGGSVIGDASLTPEELKIEALVRLTVGALLVWPGGHLLNKSRRERGSKGERSRDNGGRS